MSMSTSLQDLKNNNLNFDIVEDLESENDVEDLIKDVEQNLDEKKVSNTNYLPLNIESENDDETTFSKKKLLNQKTKFFDETPKISLKKNYSKSDTKNVMDKNDNSYLKMNSNVINCFLLLVLFLIVNHPLLNQHLDNLVKIDNYYYKYIIKGVIFVLLINLLKII
jgi:hypothetical protein